MPSPRGARSGNASMVMATSQCAHLVSTRTSSFATTAMPSMSHAQLAAHRHPDLAGDGVRQHGLADFEIRDGRARLAHGGAVVRSDVAQ